MVRKGLLVCGVLASLLYVATDLLAALFDSGYHSFTSQMISELMARGAPTERLVDPLFLAHDVLVVAFGVGVWRATTGRGHVVAALLVANGLLGTLGPTLFEMNLRGTEPGGRADLLHIALTSVLVVVILATIGVGAGLAGVWFRRYSIATVLGMIPSGLLAALAARPIAAGLPSPGLGLFERINIGLYLAWMAALAVVLLKAQRSGSAPGPAPRGRDRDLARRGPEPAREAAPGPAPRPSRA